MSYDITAKETGEHEKAIIGALTGIKSDNCAEQVLRALIHAGYEVTVKEKKEEEKVERITTAHGSACEPQAAPPPLSRSGNLW